MADLPFAARGAGSAAAALPGRSLARAALLSDFNRREGHAGAGMQADGAAVADAVRLVTRLRLAQAAARRRRDAAPPLRQDQATGRDLLHLRSRSKRARSAAGVGGGAGKLQRACRP